MNSYTKPIANKLRRHMVRIYNGVLYRGKYIYMSDLPLLLGLNGFPCSTASSIAIIEAYKDESKITNAS